MGARDLEFYDRGEAWDLVRPSPSHLQRSGRIVSALPQHVESILDVGCGNGLVTNSLSTRFPHVVGLDLSRIALGRVSASRVCGRAEALPFAQRTFDAVVSTELLEHLPVEAFVEVLSEIERVAKEYVLVTTPNNEVLEQSFGKCGVCGCTFHPYGHVRSFSRGDMEDLFEDFAALSVEPIGPRSKRLPVSLVRLAHILGGYVATPGSVCPACGNRDKFVAERGMLVRLLLGSLHRWWPAPSEPSWLLGLYRRSRTGGGEVSA